VNVYAYVQAVYLLPYAVLAVPVATSAFPALAHAEGADQSAGAALSKALRAIILLSGAAVAALIAAARPIGTFFGELDHGAGADGTAALAALPGTLVAYAPGLLGFGVAALLTRALYVRGRPWQAAAAVAAGWTVAALWPLATLPDDAGPGGTLRSLGAASSVGMTLSAAVLAWLVGRSWGPSALAGSYRTLATAVLSLAVAAGVGDLLAFTLDASTLAGAVAAGLAVAMLAVAVYLAGMLLGDRPTLRTAWARLRRGRG
jgi:putative peptidoglycan lipid II flippase